MHGYSSSNLEGTEAKSRDILINIAKMLGILLLTVVISEGMYALNLGTQNMVMLYLLAVLIISSITPHYSYGILAAALGTFIYDLLLTEPRMGFSFTIGLPITLFIMLTVTIVTGTMAAHMKENARIAFEREQRTQQLYEINQKLLAARDMGTITALAEEYLTGHLHCPAILYVKDPVLYGPEDYGPAKQAGGQTVDFFSREQQMYVHNLLHIGDSESGRPPNGSGNDIVNIPVVSKGNVLGVIGIACGGKPLGHSQLTFVRMLAGQIALALELQYLSDEQNRILVEAEKEKTRGTLLRSISHDLRTPLTAIFGASSAILEQKNLTDATKENLVKDIRTDAQWLIRMVENILIITRISGDNLRIKKEPEAAEEIVSESVSIVRKRFPDYTFNILIPDELLIVPMDATLISQVLINLLENAAKNSPEGSLILVNLKEKDGYAIFDIIDNGCGIPVHLLDTLFEAHYPSVGDAADASRSGIGIGLSICKTIIQEHGGYIEGYNRTKQGARFSFRLPIQEAVKTNE